MKKTVIMIAIFSVILVTAGMQVCYSGGHVAESPDSGLSSINYLKMRTPYLEKGLLYLGTAGILIIIWLLLRYKV